MTDQIASLGVNVGANTAQFDTKMKSVRKNAKGTATSIKSSFSKAFAFDLDKSFLTGFASAISIGLFTSAIKGAMEYAGSLGEMSQQIGVTTRDLQTLRYAAGQMGVSQEEVDKGLSKLTITLGQVAAGAKAPIAALNAIGISAKDVAGLDTGEAFRKIADGLAGIPDRAQRAAVEVALFGRTGAKLDTMLSGGSKALNELAAAAETLGIVLSDEQIRKADETADKLDAIKTVLSAKIAGVVSDNASSILELANAFAQVGVEALNAVAKISKFLNAAKLGYIRAQLTGVEFADMVLPDALGGKTRDANRKALQGRRSQIKKQMAAADMSRIMGAGLNAGEWGSRRGKTSGGIPQFLGGGGGGGSKGRDTSKDAERARLDALRDAFRFDEDMRRADMDILRAKQALAPTYVERAALDIQMLDLEKAAYQAELDNQVAVGEMSKAQAAQLMSKYQIADADRRKAVLADEEVERQRTYNALDDKDFEIKQDILQKQAGLAETAGERRKLELEMLQLEYDHRKMVLERIMRESKDYAEIESARRELANLGANQALDRKGVMQSTQGPMEQYFSDVPQTAAQAQEAMEALKVQGIDGAINSIIALQDGFQSMKDTAVSAIKQIIAELIRMQLMKMAMNIIGSAAGAPPGSMGSSGPYMGVAGSIPGFATGGGFDVMGNHGTDRNMLSLNGLPIAKVSHGERVSVSNDNPMQGGGGFTFNNYARMSADEARRTGMQAAAGYRAEMNRATRKGF